MGNFMVRGYTRGLMDKNMKGKGRLEENKAKVQKLILMEESM